MSDYVEVPIDGKLVRQLMRMTKKELIEKFCIAALEANVAKTETVKLKLKLDLAESYVEQGRSMIEAVMDRWHEYDV